jgi:hypothetical protein
MALLGLQWVSMGLWVASVYLAIRANMSLERQVKDLLNQLIASYQENAELRQTIFRAEFRHRQESVATATGPSPRPDDCGNESLIGPIQAKAWLEKGAHSRGNFSES